MPEPSARQGQPTGRRHRPSPPSVGEVLPSIRENTIGLACRSLVIAVIGLMAAAWSAPLHAQGRSPAAANGNPFDIGIIIDNRPLPATAAAAENARSDVDALMKTLDQHMFIEHIMVFERPTIEVVCDVFGCPGSERNADPFPPLIWQITRQNEARLLVYYLGDGRIEGRERQLLFRRRENGPPGDVAAFNVNRLHRQMEEAAPNLAVLMMDTSFAPRPLPCVSDNPRLINDALLTVRRTFQRIMQNQRLPRGHIELAATTPVQAPHCDRFDQTLDDIERPLFTKFLLKGITEGEADRGPFGDGDRLIELSELETYLDDRLKRAARFQWGRLQNVRAVGSESRVLASVDRRDLRDHNSRLMDRRRTPVVDDGIPVAGSTVGEDEAADPTSAVAADARARRCRDNPEASDCHACVIDPDGAACAEHCRENSGSDLCAEGLRADISPGEGADVPTGADLSGAPVADAILDQQEQESVDQLTERSAVCSWVAGNVGPYTTTLMDAIAGGTESTCGWAVDRSVVERGPIARIFTPIGWRLGRSGVQDSLVCLLDCNGEIRTDARPLPAASAPTIPAPLPIAPEERVDPRTVGAFNRAVCDRLHEPMPPYIGLPRWMPGTLLVSETLRASFGCPPPPAEPELPVPLVVAIEPVPAPEPPEPDPIPEPEGPEAPSVADADDRLNRWPRTTTGLPEEGGVPAAESGSPPPIESADSTPLQSDGPSDVQPPSDPPPSTPGDGFRPTESQVRWLQSALTVDNHNPGPIDGVIGPRTDAALRSWRLANSLPAREGPLSEEEFRAIIQAFGERFEQVQAAARAF